MCGWNIRKACSQSLARLLIITSGYQGNLGSHRPNQRSNLIYEACPSIVPLHSCFETSVSTWVTKNKWGIVFFTTKLNALIWTPLHETAFSLIGVFDKESAKRRYQQYKESHDPEAGTIRSSYIILVSSVLYWSRPNVYNNFLRVLGHLWAWQWRFKVKWVGTKWVIVRWAESWDIITHHAWGDHRDFMLRGCR